MAQLEDEAAQSTSALGPLIGLTREDIFGAVAVMLRETASDPQRLMKHGQDMGQDMVKGRRTEITFLNGYVVDRGREIGIDAPANAALTDIVQRVERGEIEPDPAHIVDLRLN